MRERAQSKRANTEEKVQESVAREKACMGDERGSASAK
jgi:hypothetical protein